MICHWNRKISIILFQMYVCSQGPSSRPFKINTFWSKELWNEACFQNWHFWLACFRWSTVSFFCCYFNTVSVVNLSFLILSFAKLSYSISYLKIHFSWWCQLLIVNDRYLVLCNHHLSFLSTHSSLAIWVRHMRPLSEDWTAVT